MLQDVQDDASNTPPLNTWRNDPVVITSKRRHFDVITSKWRRFDAITTSLLRNVSAHSLQLPVTPSRSTLEVGWEDIALTNGAKKYVTTAKNKKVELANVREALKANNYSEWVHHLPPVTTERLRWRHNDHAGVSNHQPPGCLLNRLFRRKSKKTSKLRVTGLCAGNSPGTGEFSAQMASYAENVSIWWRHHGMPTKRETWQDSW